jgi:hypothetical protein
MRVAARPSQRSENRPAPGGSDGAPWRDQPRPSRQGRDEGGGSGMGQHNDHAKQPGAVPGDTRRSASA